MFGEDDYGIAVVVVDKGPEVRHSVSHRPFRDDELLRTEITLYKNKTHFFNNLNNMSVIMLNDTTLQIKK